MWSWAGALATRERLWAPWPLQQGKGPLAGTGKEVTEKTEPELLPTEGQKVSPRGQSGQESLWNHPP